MSGGVDSSVVALLINHAIKKNLICIMVDTGLMRKKMNLNIPIEFLKKYKLNLKIVNASETFLNALKNISNPEKKKNNRKIIY